MGERACILADSPSSGSDRQLDVVKSAAARTDDDASRLASMIDLMLTVSYIDGVFHQREWAFLHHYVDSVLVMIEQSGVGSPEDRARLRGGVAVSTAASIAVRLLCTSQR